MVVLRVDKQSDVVWMSPQEVWKHTTPPPPTPTLKAMGMRTTANGNLLPHHLPYYESQSLVLSSSSDPVVSSFNYRPIVDADQLIGFNQLVVARKGTTLHTRGGVSSDPPPLTSAPSSVASSCSSIASWRLAFGSGR